MIRKIKYQDFKDISRIIGKTWNYQNYQRSPRNCEISARIDLLSCLVLSNFSSVAVIDGKIAGFLLANIKNSPIKENFNYLNEELKSLKEKLKKSVEGKIFLDYYRLYEIVDKGLKKKINYQGKNEVVLFAIDPEYRGQGIGKALINNFFNSLKQLGENDCFLFTDTTCDYPFYFNYDFKEKSRDSAIAELRNGEKIKFFLFEKSKI